MAQMPKVINDIHDHVNGAIHGLQPLIYVRVSGFKLDSPQADRGVTRLNSRDWPIFRKPN